MGLELELLRFLSAVAIAPGSDCCTFLKIPLLPSENLLSKQEVMIRYTENITTLPKENFDEPTFRSVYSLNPIRVLPVLKRSLLKII
jgi:hypothetical protein